MEIIFGGVAFAGLFTGWVVVPTIIKKRRDIKANNEESGE